MSLLTTRTVVASYEFRVSTRTPSQSKAAASALRNARSALLRIQAGPCSVSMGVYLVDVVVVISRQSPAVLPGAGCSFYESPRLSGGSWESREHLRVSSLRR